MTYSQADCDCYNDTCYSKIIHKFHYKSLPSLPHEQSMDSLMKTLAQIVAFSLDFFFLCRGGLLTDFNENL